MAEPHAAAYRALRVRVVDVVAAAGPDACDRPSPATPDWSVHDVLAHMVGVCDDVVNGRLEGIATDAWTDAQVVRRRGRSYDGMLADWDEYAPRFESMLAGAPTAIAGQALFDAATHEHDIRHALGAPGARDSDALTLAWEWLVVARADAAPAMRFVTELDDVVVGTGEPRATVHASRFELLRATTGRRSAGEIAGYGWEPLADPAVLLGSPIFTLRATPLDE
jgi:uncharacterized protein (TIGR03083 family)